MAFADRTKAQDEPASAVAHARLVGVTDNARIEQGRCLECVLVEEVGAHQLPLRGSEYGVRIEGPLHLGRARPK